MCMLTHGWWCGEVWESGDARQGLAGSLNGEGYRLSNAVLNEEDRDNQ